MVLPCTTIDSYSLAETFYPDKSPTVFTVTRVLQTMSLFFYFSICETYCTLSGRWLPGPAVSLRHTLSEIDGHLGMDHTPVLAASGPFFGNVHHGQIQHFQQAVIGWEYRFCLGDLAKLAVESLNGVGGIDQPPYFLGILEIGAEVGPVIPPGLGDFRVFPVPALPKVSRAVRAACSSTAA